MLGYHGVEKKTLPPPQQPEGTPWNGSTALFARCSPSRNSAPEGRGEAEAGARKGKEVKK